MDKKRLLDGKQYLFFIKVFMIYIFFEFLILNLHENGNYKSAVKFLGDFLTLGFIIYTFVRYRRFRLLKEQQIGLVLVFAAIAVISSVKNQGTLFDLLMGIRYLFRYYLIYAVSFYYDIRKEHFKEFSGFLIKTFFVEFPIFMIGYAFFGTLGVLYQNYLLTAVYLNLIFIMLLYEGRFTATRLLVIGLVILQSILSTSRLAVVGLVMTTIIYLMLSSKKKRFRLAVGIGSVILFVGSLAFLFLPIEHLTENATAQKFMKLRFEQTADSNFRLFLLTNFVSHSIRTGNFFGDGPNTFGDLIFHKDYHERYGFDERTVMYSADSHFVILLMQYGFFGLIAFIYFVYSLAKKTDRAFAPVVLPFVVFMILASFSIPALSIRISSFSLFVILSLTRRAV